MADTAGQLFQKLQGIIKMNQQQTCGNFADINDDIDDMRRRLISIEDKIDNMAAGAMKPDRSTKEA